MAVRSFRDLEVWQVAHGLTLAAYQETSTFPKQEMFGLTSQSRRSVASVPANIAEGWGRRSTKDYLRHLSIANGSLEELKYFLLLASDLAYLTPERYLEMESLANRISSMIHALEGALKSPLGGHAGTPNQSEPLDSSARPTLMKSRIPIPATRNP